MELDQLCIQLREIAVTLFGPPRDDWALGKVRIGSFGPCTIYLPDRGTVDIQLSPRAENDFMQTIYQLAHEVCHTLHPSRDGVSLLADETSVLNEGISAWFSCFICDKFEFGEIARASTEQTLYGHPMRLMTELMSIDRDIIRKLRAYQPYIDRLTVADFIDAGVLIPDELARSLTCAFNK